MQVIFCKKCVESNLRYIGSAQHRDQKDDNKQRTLFQKKVFVLHVYIMKKKLIGMIERKNY